MQTTIESRREQIQHPHKRSFASIISFSQRYSRLWMGSILLISDLISLTIAGFLAIILKSHIGTGLKLPDQYFRMAPFLVLFVGLYAWRGLYTTVGMHPVEELRRLAVSTSVVFLLITGFTFWARGGEIYSRMAFAFAWVLSLSFVQGARWLVRIVCIFLGLWGEPVAVVGFGPQGKNVTRYLSKNLRFGLRPVVVIHNGEQIEEEKTLPIRKIKYDERGSDTIPFRLSGVRMALLVTSEMSKELQEAIVNQHRFGFERLVLISDFSWIGSVGIIPYDLEGFLGLEVRHNLLNTWEQRLKRAIDISIALIGLTIGLPLFVLISLLIRLDSKGQALFSHERIGKKGKKLKVWKFRSMYVNADEVLNDHLKRNPDAKLEWEKTQKLKNDPRVTRLGRFLRKTSLDEIPQLWNVLKGDMSMVGPRPIVKDEVRHYSDGYSLYTQVLPGVTGLWQVSGRNDVGYNSRVRLDEYYVRNWSIWLDFYILLRTVWVVLRQRGAY